MNKIKIVHIITGLQDGGAENILYKICQYDKINHHVVISIISEGKYLSLLNNLGIKVFCLNMKFYSILKFIYLIKLIRSLKPDIVQTWLVHGDFIGGIAAKIAGIKNIVWNVLYSKLDISVEKIRTIIIIKILAKLSYIIPKLIIVISKSAQRNCVNIGFKKNKIKLVNSGFDLSIFKISRQEALDFKKEYKIPNKIPIIGIVARFHPIKDHSNLLNALSILRTKNKKFYCVLVGTNMRKENKILLKEIKKLQLDAHIKLLGSLNNISQVMNALDIKILCSKSEGFSSVIVEAMACGTPCIVTDVGDSAFIVGKTGWVIPPNDSVKLASTIDKAMTEIGKKSWHIRCEQARNRVKNNFGIIKMIKAYNLIWTKVYTVN